MDEKLKKFIKNHLNLIGSNDPQDWFSIYTDLEDYDGQDLPGDFGKAMLDAGINIPIIMEEIPRRFLQYHNEVTSYKIPDNCKYIGMSGFEDTSISQIEIPEGVEGIDFLAFAGTPIKEILIPNSVKYLGNSIFHDCEDLEKATLTSVNDLGAGIFHGCKKLTQVYLNRDIQRIDLENFNGCINLKEVYYEGTLEEFLNRAYGPIENTTKFICSDGDYIWEQK